jgi:hypothetical protein
MLLSRKVHFLNGLVIGVFILSHLCVHLFALAGPQAHNGALKSVQWAYRNWFVEPLLVAALLAQIGVGLRLALRRLRAAGRKCVWAKLQLASGFYLLYFVLNHTIAALYTRYSAGLETNFWWVSGPLLHPKMAWWFYPYYALAVLSICVHIGAVLHFRGHKIAARLVALVAVPIVLAYWASFGGWLYPVALQPDYRDYYDGLLLLFGVK